MEDMSDLVDALPDEEVFNVLPRDGDEDSCHAKVLDARLRQCRHPRNMGLGDTFLCTRHFKMPELRCGRYYPQSIFSCLEVGSRITRAVILNGHSSFRHNSKIVPLNGKVVHTYVPYEKKVLCRDASQFIDKLKKKKSVPKKIGPYEMMTNELCILNLRISGDDSYSTHMGIFTWDNSRKKGGRCIQTFEFEKSNKEQRVYLEDVIKTYEDFDVFIFIGCQGGRKHRSVEIDNGQDGRVDPIELRR